MKYDEIIKYAVEISPALLDAFNVMEGGKETIESRVNEALTVLSIIYPDLAGTENFNKAAVLYGYYGVQKVSQEQCNNEGWVIPAVIPYSVKEMLKGV